VLILTAIAHPRTMGMALEGLRGPEVITPTAPQRRLAIKTCAPDK
jgi:transcription-repair coupling factor (superfamily II helicase)